MRKSFVTSKGTELPLLSLKGKEYLQVMHRIQWFREENPKGAIKTKIVNLDRQGGAAIVEAVVMKFDEENKMLIEVASDVGSETAKDFGDYLEKAATKAIGRALALAGYGTQFASDELDEQHRIVDSPAPVLESSSTTAVASSSTSNGTATPKVAGGFKKVHKTETKNSQGWS